ncbi:hypothetical protein JOF53_007456 [Crossiella equi]|uniref:Pentapeptide repeat-containing protein n=1 Tax=Crossiella equi TaxID=130796 RepID=A0ABS5AQT9_9PSEU|nr:pentapeptide repeat-containing protein [Crossiella equi]MBP2478584.1 hypothetical protein [Crossiella equi]
MNRLSLPEKHVSTLLAVVVVLVGALTGWALWADGSHGEAVRTAVLVSAVLGAGLVLPRAVRRSPRPEPVAPESCQVTELFARAAEQLGSERAAVRLAGVYALERLAQDHPGHRQLVVDLWCGYLRLPSEGGTAEEQVRASVAHVLAEHLRAGTDFWPDVDLDLRGAVLDGFDLGRTVVRELRCAGASFGGRTTFGGCQVTGRADFARTRFRDTADFSGAVFRQDADFGAVTFTGDARFAGAVFEGDAWFVDATFLGHADLTGVICGEENLSLDGAQAPLTGAARGLWPAGWSLRAQRSYVPVQRPGGGTPLGILERAPGTTRTL